MAYSVPANIVEIINSRIGTDRTQLPAGHFDNRDSDPLARAEHVMAALAYNVIADVEFIAKYGRSRGITKAGVKIDLARLQGMRMICREIPGYDLMCNAYALEAAFIAKDQLNIDVSK